MYAAHWCRSHEPNAYYCRRYSALMKNKRFIQKHSGCSSHFHPNTKTLRFIVSIVCSYLGLVSLGMIWYLEAALFVLCKGHVSVWNQWKIRQQITRLTSVTHLLFKWQLLDGFISQVLKEVEKNAYVDCLLQDYTDMIHVIQPCNVCVYGIGYQVRWLTSSISVTVNMIQ